MAIGTTGAPTSARNASVGWLVRRLSGEVRRLVRDEKALAGAEMKRKGAKAVAGGGLFGGAAAVGLFGVGVLIACAVLGLATVLAAWLAALIVAVALLAVAGALALAGRRKFSAATPPLPTDVIDSVKQDIHTIAEARQR
ncbi:phage holin family protein [Frankia sp. CNm7]|uniref:Phage holin family protein n=1 Tax=Frankia nepalensis TaxID=1836974 RepID=A0A937URN6_9ACTN|nr:phage holin family protein [Frankia nepalensis]MBL7501104.1 phage holin family protein [Frankia nepalensis]MBL7512726.1 phage holin family protein [Frankia nepalensis]MBL7524116.1 phage holin family protein [Frankia nepalensis]MBL7631318.1 phage holin family protein [Frankia nepalensis]